MSGKPAARQNDMTAEGGPIVQGLREGGFLTCTLPSLTY